MPQNNSTAISPILDADVPAVALFLHREMNQKFSAEDWERGLNACWLENAPNHGFQLIDEDKIVGVICAIYSEQLIGSKPEKFCNPHTWCVLEPYRKNSVALVLSVIRQEGYHYTMFSPNQEGEEIFSYLGFKPLDRSQRILLHIPRPRFNSTVRIVSDKSEIESSLDSKQSTAFSAHYNYPWLRFLGYSKGGQAGYIIYKDYRYKGLASANLMLVSDQDLFSQCWPEISNHMLLKRGIFTSKVEQRLLNRAPVLSYNCHPSSAKFYLSDTLPPSAINYGYSELMVMDL